jgi:hypothetical protein
MSRRGGRLIPGLLPALWVAGPALAQTDEIQVYDAQIAPPGAFNLTWHNNSIVTGQHNPDHPGGVVPEHSINGVTEWAWGVTRWFEAGLYLPLYTITADGAVLVNGVKLRTLFVSPDAQDRRFFYGVNLEFSYNAAHWDPDRYTSEIRTILGWHLGRLDVILNPIFDNSYKGLSSLDFAPATRIAWNVSQRWAVAAEEYDDFGPLRHFYPAEQQTHQLFAVASYRGSVYDIEAGLGFGRTSGSDGRVFKLILSRDLNRAGR